MRRLKKRQNEITAIDLFCGAGGLTKGLEQAGIDVRLGVDIDPACEYPYTKNNRSEFLLKSIKDIKSEELLDIYPKQSIGLLAGCAPCQTFSTYNQKADPSDKRWWLLKQFSRLVLSLEPELVTMENVPKLHKESVFQDFVADLESTGYNVTYQVVNCSDYGMAQHRPRLVLLASLFGPIEILRPKQLNWKSYTVRDKIGQLPPIGAGETDNKDPLHQAAKLSPINQRRIESSVPGGTWRDWDKDLVADCHKKSTGKTYPSVYGRMSWDEPAPTMTTQFYGFGNGRFGHPEQDRAISLREGAILQSFPKSYKFVKSGKPIYKKTVGRLIGNAVPVKLGKLIGKSFIKHIAELTP
jgi:DNA (cytosine-5)-methyltransferase 1